jgi:hypothetical protein
LSFDIRLRAFDDAFHGRSLDVAHHTIFGPHFEGMPSVVGVLWAKRVGRMRMSVALDALVGDLSVRGNDGFAGIDGPLSYEDVILRGMMRGAGRVLPTRAPHIMALSAKLDVRIVLRGKGRVGGRAVREVGRGKQWVPKLRAGIRV